MTTKKTDLTLQEQYPSCSLLLHLDEDFPFSSSDTDDLEEIKRRLKLIGGKIRKNGNLLEISFESSDFVKALTRNAGRKRKAIGKCVSSLGKNDVTPIYYADLIYWHYGLKESWNQIAKRTNLSPATFYRRVKKHTDAWPYQKYMELVDLSRASDLSYLRSVEHGYDLFY